MATLCTRESFYIGGRYVKDRVGRHTMQGQMYVEHLTPARSVGGSGRIPYPLIFIHGGSRTGAVSQSLVGHLMMESRRGPSAEAKPLDAGLAYKARW